MMHRKLSLFLGLLMFGFAFSQQPENRKEQLQRQNADLKKQIANINAELAKAKGETKLSLAYLAGVNQKITLREKVVNNTQKEKRYIEDDIYKRQLEINKLIYNKIVFCNKCKYLIKCNFELMLICFLSNINKIYNCDIRKIIILTRIDENH